MSFLSKIFRAEDNKRVKELENLAEQVDNLEEDFEELSDEELQAKTVEFQERLKNGETLDDLRVEAFACVREASRRVLNMFPFKVQLMGGMALQNGYIAEMKTGEGKAITVDSKIPTPEGWKTAGNVRVGDFLLDRKGLPTKVLNVYPQGVKQVYELTLEDGRKVRCHEDHLWPVFEDFNDEIWEAVSTSTMFSLGAVNDNKVGGYNFYLPMNEAVQYSEKKYKIDPYVMGIFLCASRKDAEDFSLYSLSKKIMKKVSENLKISDVKVFQEAVHSPIWRFADSTLTRKIKISDIDEKYEELLLNTETNEKYIPEEYRLGSVSQRWHLVQAVFDYAGVVKNSKNDDKKILSFSTFSKQMMKDLLEVIYSLGFSAEGVEKQFEGTVQNIYKVEVNVPNGLVYKFFNVKQTEKMLKFKEETVVKNSKIAVIKIEKLDENVEQVCFTVDNSEHLFLVGDYVVTHNTLVATMPAYLRALSGEGVHIVTVNDYLAKYQSEMMGRLYNFLGISVGCILSDQTLQEKKRAYQADITYGTNNEFGFDYLRDNMAQKAEDMVQRGHNYVIIDEVDSILIDEARTPLIISGQADNSFNKSYGTFARIVKNLIKDEDYTVDEEKRTVSITEKGIDEVEKSLKINSLYESKNTVLIGLLNNAIKAKELFHLDKDYIVQNGEVLIVDEHTGRVLPGRRYNDGIHQAIEAKENVVVQEENQTFATITLQNYFRLYPEGSRAGMTGTAETEAAEFGNIYKMNVVVIPTNNEMIRKDNADLVFPGVKGKLNAIIEDIKIRHEKGQPILVGTASVASSEKISKMLTKEKIKHNVLNAKNNAEEAKIVAMAGRKGAVTVATNMAGRGTDIMLGGNAEFIANEILQKKGLNPVDNPEQYNTEWKKALKEAKNSVKKEHEEVVNLGGLYVLGTERHESRRIDNQLRGRSGRQGDPGESRFYISMEDDLMRLFNSKVATKVLQSGIYPENMPLESKFLTKSIATAQAKIETRNQEMRKNVLKFDDVMNDQRKIIYEERANVMQNDDLSENVNFFLEDFIDYVVDKNVDVVKETVNVDELWKDLKEYYPVSITVNDLIEEYGNINSLTSDVVKKELLEDIITVYGELKNSLNNNILAVEQLGDEPIKDLERRVLLDAVDTGWREHLREVDHLREGIGLRGMGQKDPLVEYKTETAEMFNDLLFKIRRKSVQSLFSYLRQFNEIKLKEEERDKEIAAAKNVLNVMGSVGQKTIDEIASENSKTSGNRAQRRASKKKNKKKKKK